MPQIYVNNQTFEIAESEDRNLLEVCLSLGFDIPYFCWHPAMHSVGACRQCAVKLFKDENDTKGRIVMSCMTPAAPGTRISTDDPEVLEFRRAVIEWLMANHPHDCPICDEGGECHLQDMTVMVGHAYRRHRLPKRTHRNQYLGPFLTHEMNRCIQCYRCVRFYRDYAGGDDLAVLGCHDNVYFGRHADGVLQSEFAGNLVEVCPTGVFTDKTLKRHYTRKWDMQTAPSICTHCSLGCNTLPAERYGMLRRIRNRYNHEINGYFLCDRGRFGYEFVNSDRRIRRALLRGPSGTRQVEPAEAVGHAAKLLRAGRAIGIGSPRASLEANFALRRLVGADNFFHGMPGEMLRDVRMILDILRQGPAPAASLRDVGQADAVIVLGQDVTNVAPMLALAIRQSLLERPMADVRRRVQGLHNWDDAIIREAIQQAKGPLYIATADATKLDQAATMTFRLVGPDIARLGFEIANNVDPSCPSVPGLPDNTRDFARIIARDLLNAQRPLVVAGHPAGDSALLHAAANVAWALVRMGKQAKLCFAVPDCNSIGAGLLPGGSIDDALRAIRDGSVETVVVVENDLYRHVDAALADELLGSAHHVIAVDSLTGATSGRAEVVLPAATFAEGSGTLVNNEARAQRFFQVFQPDGDVRESWRWLGELLAGRDDCENPFYSLDAVLAAMGEETEALRGAAEAAPDAATRLAGQKVPRQPARYSGRTAMHADKTVHEPRPPADQDTPLAHSMEGFAGLPPGPLVSRYWSPGWNSPQAVTKFQQEVAGILKGGQGGKRLIEPAAGADPRYFDDVPEPFARVQGRWFFVPAWHIFGSEELSALSPGIAELAPKAYVALGAGDAAALSLSEGELAEVTIERRAYRLPVRIRPLLPAGAAMLPVGLSDLPGVVLPAWGTVGRAGAAGDKEQP